jgi:urocanate hydratase
LTLDPTASPGLLFTLEVYKLHCGLIQATNASSRADSGREQGLGGMLLYAGELDESGRALVVAGNIAGAATLTAAADPARQKQAVRDGVVDFLVTSLDEALRILKNEIRKKETVAVCVGAAEEAVKREMTARGVEPDLVRDDVFAAAENCGYRREKLRQLEEDSMPAEVLVIWRVDSSPAQWLAKLDRIALDCIEPGDGFARRWLRLAGRYMGRLGHGAHLLISDWRFAMTFVERVREQVRLGEIGVRAQIQVRYRDRIDEHNFVLSKADEAN